MKVFGYIVGVVVLLCVLNFYTLRRICMEQIFETEFSERFNEPEDLDIFYSYFHFAGTPNRIIVDKVTILNPKEKMEDFIFSVEFTILWEGPLVKNGVTKAMLLLNPNAKEKCSINAISSNGILIDGVHNASSKFMRMLNN